MPLAHKLACPAIVALVLVTGGRGPAAELGPAGAPSADVSRAGFPAPDMMFKLAQGAWRARSESPFVTFSLRERYTWRGRVHDNWWSGFYRNVDRNLVLHRMLVAQDESARMKGFPIGLNLRIHGGSAKADSLDTNADADAFPILDPLIDPNTSFGMIAQEPRSTLAGTRAAAPSPAVSDALAPASALATASPPGADAAGPASSFGAEKPLRELAHVEAVARDYAIVFAGTDHLAAGDAYHLTLTPLRDPQANRLRDLWVDPTSYATMQVAMQGLFVGKPYDGARWIVDYVAFGGRPYVQHIRTDEALRFGMDRSVTDLQYDFVAYDFPASIPDVTFRRLL